MKNFISSDNKNKDKLLQRFIKYTKIWSESNEENANQGIFPSTKQQFDFAEELKNELISLKLENVQVTKDCYVYGYLPSSKGLENIPSILLMAHLDTVDEVTGKNVNPLIKNSEGFNDDKTDKIITSDGTTLLGADDKAGIAAIMSAVEFLSQNTQIKHSAIEVMFSPDEETGHGMDKVPLNLIKSKFAYTVDGGSLGEMETECFNAWSCKITFIGKACHTGDAKKGRMINSTKMAAAFISKLPQKKSPETTENYQGFIAPMKINGTIEESSVELLLRAFTSQEIEKEKSIINQTAKKIEKKYGGTTKIIFKQQYLNMKEKMDQHPSVVEKLKKAYNQAGVKIVQKPIRGGTDGSRLTELGIPTPNIFTGAHCFHSRNEWCSLNEMAKSADILINLTLE